jgi:predicted enzyme related to lactoylglutathione lyase
MDLSQHFKGTYGTMYYVTDMKKAVQYYRDMFDLKPESESDEWSSFDIGGHRICLHNLESGKTSDGKGVLITNVTNLKGMVVELKKRGVEFVEDIKQVCEGGYSADFRDPSGNLVSLFEYKG